MNCKRFSLFDLNLSEFTFGLHCKKHTKTQTNKRRTNEWTNGNRLRKQENSMKVPIYSQKRTEKSKNRKNKKRETAKIKREKKTGLSTRRECG